MGNMGPRGLYQGARVLAELSSTLLLQLVGFLGSFVGLKISSVVL